MTIPARIQSRLGWRAALCLLLACPALLPTQTLAQAFPSKPIHIVVPFAAGGAVDVVARAVGGSPRAVGGANGRNPIPIVIPCHRVVATTGIGGYSGGDGLPTKRFLLALENTGQAGGDLFAQA